MPAVRRLPWETTMKARFASRVTASVRQRLRVMLTPGDSTSRLKTPRTIG
jgi:hypothetical protein